MKKRLKLITLLILLLFFVLQGLVLPIELNAAENSEWSRKENIYLFKMHINNNLVINNRGSYLTTYKYSDGYLVPFQRFCDLLKLGVDVNLNNSTAEGFIISEKRKFKLNATKQTVQVDGNSYKFSSYQVRCNSKDLYIAHQHLEKWLPLKIEIKPYQAIINIKPEKELPIQKEIKRKLRWESLNKYNYSGSSYPYLKTDKRLIDGPFIDLALDWTNSKKNRLYYETSTSVNLLGAQANLYINGFDRTGITDISYTIGRSDPRPILLGELKARKVMLGDVG